MVRAIFSKTFRLHNQDTVFATWRTDGDGRTDGHRMWMKEWKKKVGYNRDTSVHSICKYKELFGLVLEEN